MSPMLAAWNEKDPERIRGHLDIALAPDIAFADPDNFVEGIDAFEAVVRTFLVEQNVSTPAALTPIITATAITGSYRWATPPSCRAWTWSS
ncbi:MAG: nuclear transport factor 2 family protein [Robiginitomaculum sp.]|nr:nuclear transport factor 2 family protein [Robiginitomaculum sp.]